MTEKPADVGLMGQMWRRRRRTIARLILVALAVILGFGAASAQESAPNRAGLVIADGVGQVRAYCVEFVEEQINGLTLLDRAPVQAIMGQVGPGLAVCKIDNTGCSNPQSCFCDLQMFWSYWQLDGGVWRYSNVGGGLTTVTNGTVEGWAWTQVAPTGQEPPDSGGLPAMTFEEICPSVPATPTPTESPTATATGTVTGSETPTPTATRTPATATATFTPSPTFTSIPTSTPVPTATPTGTPTQFPVPIINRFTADRTEITFGESTTLFWDVTGAQTVYLRMPGMEEVVPAQGTRVVAPEKTSSYSIVGVNPGGENGAALTIAVNPVFATPTSAAPTPTNTSLPTPVPAPTDTPSPALAPTNTTSPTDTPVPTATETATVTATETPMLTPDVLVIVPTGAPTGPAGSIEAAVPIESVTLPGETRADQTRRLVMLGGLVLIAGLPLLFAGIWLILWVFWKQ